MNRHLLGFASLAAILLALGLAVKGVSRAKQAGKEQEAGLQEKIQQLDYELTNSDKRVAIKKRSLQSIESFYHAWIPHVYKCQDTESLMSNILVRAYDHDLIPAKKTLSRNIKLNLRGSEHLSDLIDVTLSGQYENLVTFLGYLRGEYPFVRTDMIEFSVTDATMTMSLQLAICKFDLTDDDLSHFSETNLLKNASIEGS